MSEGREPTYPRPRGWSRANWDMLIKELKEFAMPRNDAGVGLLRVSRSDAIHILKRLEGQEAVAPDPSGIKWCVHMEGDLHLFEDMRQAEEHRRLLQAESDKKHLTGAGGFWTLSPVSRITCHAPPPPWPIERSATVGGRTVTVRLSEDGSLGGTIIRHTKDVAAYRIAMVSALAEYERRKGDSAK